MICMLNALLSCHVLSEGTTCLYVIPCIWNLCVVHGNGLGNHLLDLLCNSVAWPVATQTERGQHGGHCLCDKLRKMGTCHVLFCPYFMSLHTDAAHMEPAHGTSTWNQHMEEPAHSSRTLCWAGNLVHFNPLIAEGQLSDHLLCLLLWQYDQGHTLTHTMTGHLMRPFLAWMPWDCECNQFPVMEIVCSDHLRSWGLRRIILNG